MNTVDYKQTLNLPRTGFPMKANLAQREPARLKRWQEQGLYEIFEDMMRSLIINRPEDPVKFLMDKFEKPESK